MILNIAVLIASVLQVVAAVFLNLGSFDSTERTLQVFIQPASWAFSIWGLIYTLSFIYAVYQVIPKNDNPTLRATRLPAFIGFASSIAWLYFAGSTGWLVWLTAPVLFLMAISFVFVLRAPDATDKKQTFFSKQILYPYAAWTGIAAWLNVQTLLTDQSIITDPTTNMVTNGVLFVCIALFTMYHFRQTGYNIWYGGVMVWAGVAVVFANLGGGSTLFAILGGVLAVATAGLFVRRCIQEESQ